MLNLTERELLNETDLSNIEKESVYLNRLKSVKLYNVLGCDIKQFG